MNTVITLALVLMSAGNPISGTPESKRRRSQRVILSLAVVLRTEDAPKEVSFEEQTRTLVVNLHGALVTLSAAVKNGQKLRLTNLATHADQVCRVVYLGSPTEGKVQVGVEFVKPAPDFWHIAFPPDDWIIPKPEPVASDSE